MRWKLSLILGLMAVAVIAALVAYHVALNHAQLRSVLSDQPSYSCQVGCVPHIASNQKGDTIIAWTRDDLQDDFQAEIQTAIKPQGSGWGQAQLASAPVAFTAQVGLGNNGRALLVWKGQAGDIEAQWSAEGNWAEPQLISKDTYDFFSSLSPGGDAVVVSWGQWSYGKAKIFTISRSHQGEPWVKTYIHFKDNIDMGEAEVRHIAISDNGDVALLFTPQGLTGSGEIFTASRTGQFKKVSNEKFAWIGVSPSRKLAAISNNHKNAYLIENGKLLPTDEEIGALGSDNPFILNQDYFDKQLQVFPHGIKKKSAIISRDPLSDWKLLSGGGKALFLEKGRLSGVHLYRYHYRIWNGVRWSAVQQLPATGRLAAGTMGSDGVAHIALTYHNGLTLLDSTDLHHWNKKQIEGRR